MMSRLQLHPDCPCEAVARIEAEAVRGDDGALTLRYVVRGDMQRVRVPPPAQSARVDELWKRTCFEAFVRTAESEAYAEFNFSPSTQWAAYAFTRHREGMNPHPLTQPPRIEARAYADWLELDVALSPLGFFDAAPWRIGLSAVLETVDGALSYWALAHPLGKPDFHHIDCFALELRPPEPP